MFNIYHQQKLLFSLSVLSCLSLASPVALAQVFNYGIGDAVRDTNVAKPPAKTTEPPAPVIIQEEETPLTLADGEKMAVRDFRVEGADFLDGAEVSALLQPYRNRELNINEIRQAANKITVYAREKGYMVARAYVPKQSIQDGVLLIKVVAGKYGKFQMKNKSLVSDARLQAIFEHAKQKSDIVTKEGLERPILLVNDTPGARMPLVSIAPGTEPGTSDFMVETEAADRVQAYVMADNYGSRFTGENRVTGEVVINSPFGIGDRISVKGTTTKAAGLQNARAAYELPLNNDGLRLEVAAAKTTYKLGDDYISLEATGEAEMYSARLSYPIKRTREDSIYLSFDVTNKQLKDSYFSGTSTTAKKANVATLNLQRETYGSLFGLYAYSNVNVGAAFGRLSFDDKTLQAKSDTAGNFSKLNLSFFGNLAFTDHWSVDTTAQVQDSLGNRLDGVEQFSVSGPSGIKSYPDGVIGDKGYLVGAELKYAINPGVDISHTVGVFANYGSVKLDGKSYTYVANNAVQTADKLNISDIGLAYNLASRKYFGRLQVAKTTGNSGATAVYNDEVKVQAMLGLRF